MLANGQVGYMKLAGVSARAQRDDFHDLLDELINTDQVQAIVLDLRDDPGGYVGRGSEDRVRVRRRQAALL